MVVVARTRASAASEAAAAPRSLRVQEAVTLACLGAFVLTGAALLWLDVRYGDQPLEGALLLAVVIAVVARCAPAGRGAPGAFDHLFAALCVAVPAALGHNMSVGVLRWTYDNNPLVPIALALLATVLCEMARALEIGISRLAVGVLVMITLQGLTSGRALERWETVNACTERWPEVRYLRGALLPPGGAGVRGLVKLVRGLADQDADEVLFLPEDPDLQARFERRRPALTSQIVFTDQYRDRYVDEDFRHLKEHPPKVIVIGPRNSWRPFSRIFHRDLGAERLIDRVQAELLPALYERAAEHPIAYQKRTDVMDVFVRKPPGTPPP
jgi:hypothetical protein